MDPVAGTRGCTWFVRAPSNNCTISPTDKWISRGGARTVGACTAPREEQGPPHVLRHVRLPHGRCPSIFPQKHTDPPLPTTAPDGARGRAALTACQTPSSIIAPTRSGGRLNESVV